MDSDTSNDPIINPNRNDMVSFRLINTLSSKSITINPSTPKNIGISTPDVNSHVILLCPPVS